MRRFIVAAMLLLGLLAGATNFVGSAGATPVNPGPNTGCTAGTDHCSGWLPSKEYPCAVYNVLWDHIWADPNNPGGPAMWHVLIQQWWACADQGGVHLIGNAGDFYFYDWEVPHNNIYTNGTQGVVEFMGHWNSSYNGTYGVVGWSKCYSNEDAKGAYVAYDAQPELTYIGGTYGIYPGCYSTPSNQVGAGGSGSYNGSFIAWQDQVEWQGGYGYQYVTRLYLF